MLKGIASDLTGGSDICKPLTDLHLSQANAFVLPGETILFSLQSNKEEFAFTNLALIVLEGESATTTRKLITRHEYKSSTVKDIKFETAGRMDRDCEIKFNIGTTAVSIDIAKDLEPHARVYYHVLIHLSRAQEANARKWEHATLALDQSAKSMRLTEAAVKSLTTQADATLEWLQEIYKETHPRCYKDVIVGVLGAAGYYKPQ
jgi:hypothetical protein